MSIKTIAIIILSVILIVSVGYNIYSLSSHSKDVQENKLLKTIMVSDLKLADISLDKQKAESYYAEASFNYEDSNYKSVESNCRLARDYYFKSSQSYRKLKAELSDGNVKGELIDLYTEKLEYLIQISENMYESCEHFEGASRYYDMDNYDMGDVEINAMNEKIRAHDTAVKNYNDVLSEFQTKLEVILK